jgi:hypothetical protein
MDLQVIRDLAEKWVDHYIHSMVRDPDMVLRKQWLHADAQVGPGPGAESFSFGTRARYFHYGNLGATRAALPSKMSVKEISNLTEGFAHFRNPVVAAVLGMRLAFVDLQKCIDAEVAKFAVDPDGVAQ